MAPKHTSFLCSVCRKRYLVVLVYERRPGDTTGCKACQFCDRYDLMPRFASHDDGA